MADEAIDPGRLPEIATRMVHDGLFFLGLDNPVLSEPLRIVRSGIPYDRAAEELKTWFVQRLAIDPGVGEPFTDLG